VLNRPADFVESLRRELRPTASEMESWKDPGNSVVNIQTFGRFKVTVHELPLDDRAWRGAKSKALLKALIVHGGTRVPRDAVLDMLWPDTDGDMASNNLKVMLSRVRKIGAVNQQDQIPWIIVHHGEISLSRKYCSVDCLRFRDALAKALARDEEIDGLKEALGLYTDDFLPNEVSEPLRNGLRISCCCLGHTMACLSAVLIRIVDREGNRPDGYDAGSPNHFLLPGGIEVSSFPVARRAVFGTFNLL
jgi:hypothetical protein